MLAVVRQSFKPEFLNRLDEIVIFDALTREELARIVDLQLALLEKRLAVRRIEIEVTDAARAWLADVGYDPAYGARPLRRLIQTAIGDPLAKLLISGDVVDGGQVVVDRAAEGESGRGGLTLSARVIQLTHDDRTQTLRATPPGDDGRLDDHGRVGAAGRAVFERVSDPAPAGDPGRRPAVPVRAAGRRARARRSRVRSPSCARCRWSPPAAPPRPRSWATTCSSGTAAPGSRSPCWRCPSS